MSLVFPLSIGLILWNIGEENGKSFSYILNTLWAEGSNSFIYSLSCFLISFTLWNIRLTITQSKIYYSMFGIPTMWRINKYDVSHCQINPKFDSPYTWFYRKFKHFKIPESEQLFNCRYGTIEFVFKQTNIINWFRHKFSLIYLTSFSSNQSKQIIHVLEKYWDLK